MKKRGDTAATTRGAGGRRIPGKHRGAGEESPPPGWRCKTRRVRWTSPAPRRYRVQRWKHRWKHRVHRVHRPRYQRSLMCLMFKRSPIPTGSIDAPHSMEYAYWGISGANSSPTECLGFSDRNGGFSDRPKATDTDDHPSGAFFFNRRCEGASSALSRAQLFESRGSMDASVDVASVLWRQLKVCSTAWSLYVSTSVAPKQARALWSPVFILFQAQIRLNQAFLVCSSPLGRPENLPFRT